MICVTQDAVVKDVVLWQEENILKKCRHQLSSLFSFKSF